MDDAWAHRQRWRGARAVLVAVLAALALPAGAAGAGPATHFLVSAPASATAGTAFSFAVTALDASNATATGYTGTVHFTSSDGQAILPVDATLTNGVGTFAATLKTAGSQTITATDTAVHTIVGTSNAVAVSAAAATHFTLTAPSAVTTGVSVHFTLTARDQFGNTATGYAGTVHFSSSDGAATLPANATLTNGAGTFSSTLRRSAFRRSPEPTPAPPRSTARARSSSRCRRRTSTWSGRRARSPASPPSSP